MLLELEQHSITPFHLPALEDGHAVVPVHLRDEAEADFLGANRFTGAGDSAVAETAWNIRSMKTP